jgi:hypothetical protein
MVPIHRAIRPGHAARRAGRWCPLPIDLALGVSGRPNRGVDPGRTSCRARPTQGVRAEVAGQATRGPSAEPGPAALTRRDGADRDRTGGLRAHPEGCRAPGGECGCGTHRRHRRADRPGADDGQPRRPGGVGRSRQTKTATGATRGRGGRSPDLQVPVRHMASLMGVRVRAGEGSRARGADVVVGSSSRLRGGLSLRRTVRWGTRCTTVVLHRGRRTGGRAPWPSTRTRHSSAARCRR